MKNFSVIELKKLLSLYSQLYVGKTLCIICNKKQTESKHAVGTFDYETEYLSDGEFEQVVNLFSCLELNTEYFLDEDSFINYYYKLPLEKRHNIIVYNAAQSGTGAGRKSLIPAFCNMHNIICTGSDAYVVSLCRHKYHVNKLLSSLGIRVPETFLYKDGWLMNRCPAINTKIILKPIYESASIGIDDSSVMKYSNSCDEIISKKVKELNEPFIAQQFIDGYEVEFPTIVIKNKIIPLTPVGLSLNGTTKMNGEILNYKRIYEDNYRFFDFDKINGIDLCETTKNTVKSLNMQGLCRVDFRVDNDDRFYVTDVSTNPHFVRHSSVHNAFKYLNLTEDFIAKSIITSAVVKFNDD